MDEDGHWRTADRGEEMRGKENASMCCWLMGGLVKIGHWRSSVQNIWNVFAGSSLR